MENQNRPHWLSSEARLKDVLLANLKLIPDPKPFIDPRDLETLPPRARRMAQQPWFGLDICLTNLIASHLSLDPTWPYLERWLDNTEFSSMTVTDGQAVEVTGSLWWGYRDNIRGAQTPEAIEAHVAISGEELSYSINLYADGLCRHITNTGVTCHRLESRGERQTDIADLLASLKNKGEKAPPKSPMIHFYAGPLIHDINYVTAYTIAQSGADGITALSQLLKDEDPQLRTYAVYALGLAKGEARTAVPAIRDAMSGADRQFRCLAAVALCRILLDADRVDEGPVDEREGEADAPLLGELYADLIAALDGASYEAYETGELFRDTAETATRLLTQLASNDHNLMPLLLAAFENKDIRRHLAKIFYNLGPAAETAIPVLTEAMKDVSNELWRFAAYALARIGVQGLHAVTESLQASDWKPRYFAILILGEIKERELIDVKPAVPALLQALREQAHDARLRCSLAEVLATIDREDQQVRKALRSVLPDCIKDIHHSEYETARKAIDALGAMRGLAHDAIPELMAVVNDDGRNAYLQGRALCALGNIGPDDDVDDDDDEVIAFILGALKRDASYLSFIGESLLISSEEATAPLLSTIAQLIQDRRDNHLNLFEVFKMIEKLGPASLPLLINLSKETDNTLSFRVFDALHRFGKAAVPCLLEALQLADARALAIQALAKIGADAAEAIPALREFLRSDDYFLCARAAEALGQIGESAVPALMEASQNGHAFAARWAAAVLEKFSDSPDSPDCFEKVLLRFPSPGYSRRKPVKGHPSSN